MSAFMCSDRHLTVLASYAVRHGLTGLVSRPGRADLELIVEVFGTLARENMASLNARYPGDTGDAIGTVRPAAIVERPDPLTIIKACHCYAYQSCEHGAWEGSEAHTLVQAIEAHAVRHLPGYDAAPWGL